MIVCIMFWKRSLLRRRLLFLLCLPVQEVKNKSTLSISSHEEFLYIYHLRFVTLGVCVYAVQRVDPTSADRSKRILDHVVM